MAAWLGRLVDQVEPQWVPPSELPVHIIHGDIRLGNVTMSDERGSPVYYDFGFSARRPRIHDLAYSLSWMVLKPDASGRPEDFDWARVPELLAAYEDGADSALETSERRALGPYLAAVPLYLAAIASHTPDPVAHLREERPFLRIAGWVLAHPEALSD